MYANYPSLKEPILREIENQKSVLSKFPENISRPITQSCSKYLAQFTSFQLPFKPESNAKTNQQAEASSVLLQPSQFISASNATTATTITTTSNNDNTIKEENETSSNQTWVIDKLYKRLFKFDLNFKREKSLWIMPVFKNQILSQ